MSAELAVHLIALAGVCLFWAWAYGRLKEIERKGDAQKPPAQEHKP
jgi:hypothetical protein